MAADVLAKMSVVIGAQTAEFSKKLNESSNNVKKFQTNVSGVGKLLGTAFAAFSAIQIGKDILDTTAKFEKLRAVLANTLGSSSQADQAFQRIQDSAAKTPFQVDKLTASFVKLANQGFVPTTDELRKLGDVAAPQGKSFDQLTEAIIDAQTGEFERLKEFGIRAKKQGDQVSFTFKGVKKQVDFTSESIRQYVLGLGDAQGVSGSMEAISGTLTGRISNLGDSFDALFVAIGNLNSGPLKELIAGISSLVQKMADYIKFSQSDPIFDAFNKQTAEAVENFKKLDKAAQAKSINQLAQDVQLARKDMEELNKWYAAFTESINKGSSFSEAVDFAALQSGFELTEQEAGKFLENQQFEVDATKKAYESLSDQLKQFMGIYNTPIDNTSVQKAQKVQIDNLKALQEELKNLNERYETQNANDQVALANTAKKIAVVKGEIAVIEQLRDRMDKVLNTELIVSIPPVDTAPLFSSLDGLQKRLEGYIKPLGSTAQQIQQKFVDIGDSIKGSLGNAISSLAEAMGEAAVGVGNFGDAIIKTLINFAKQVGEILIATGIGMIAAKAALKNPYTAIAAGVALVALASAASAGLQKAQAGVGGGGSSGGSAVSNSSDFTRGASIPVQSINIEGRVIGRDLVFLYDKNKTLDRDRKG